MRGCRPRPGPREVPVDVPEAEMKAGKDDAREGGVPVTVLIPVHRPLTAGGGRG